MNRLMTYAHGHREDLDVRYDYVVNVCDPSPAMTLTSTKFSRELFSKVREYALAKFEETGRTVTIVPGRYACAHAPCLTIRKGF